MTGHDALTLRSVTPDGCVIETQFPSQWNPASITAREEQAHMHREDVRMHLRTIELWERAA